MSRRAATRIAPGVEPRAQPPRAIERELRALLAAGCRIRPAGSGARAARGAAPALPADATRSRCSTRASTSPTCARTRTSASSWPTSGSAPRATSTRASSTRTPRWSGAAPRTSSRRRACTGSARATSSGSTRGRPDRSTAPRRPRTCRSRCRPPSTTLSRRAKRVPWDARALRRVLRRAPVGRFEAYADFIGPRRRAAGEPRDRIHGGRPVAWFERPNDPASLRFAPGFAPDFARVVEVSRSAEPHVRRRDRGSSASSRRTGAIQYQFVAGPHHVWIIPRADAHHRAVELRRAHARRDRRRGPVRARLRVPLPRETARRCSTARSRRASPAPRARSTRRAPTPRPGSRSCR